MTCSLMLAVDPQTPKNRAAKRIDYQERRASPVGAFLGIMKLRVGLSWVEFRQEPTKLLMTLKVVPLS